MFLVDIRKYFFVTVCVISSAGFIGLFENSSKLKQDSVTKHCENVRVICSRKVMITNKCNTKKNIRKLSPEMFELDEVKSSDWNRLFTLWIITTNGKPTGSTPRLREYSTKTEDFICVESFANRMNVSPSLALNSRWVGSQIFSKYFQLSKWFLLWSVTFGRNYKE